MSDRMKPKIVQAAPGTGNPFAGWIVHEKMGAPVVNSIFLLSEEERKKKTAELEEVRQEYQKTGESTAPDVPYVCPNGCAGPFRRHGLTTTLVGWFQGLDPNHWTEQCSCEACGTHFVKEWVLAKNNGKPWYSVSKDGKQILYHGEPACCESRYTRPETVK